MKPHGMSRTHFYGVWNAMKQRCGNKNSPYFYRYGGRGITVCREWLLFEGFRDDMFATYKPTLTLERINNDGGYNKANCTWATRTEQTRNRSTKCKVIAPRIREMHKAGALQNDIAKHFNISQSSVSLLVNNNHYAN